MPEFCILTEHILDSSSLYIIYYCHSAFRSLQLSLSPNMLINCLLL